MEDRNEKILDYIDRLVTEEKALRDKPVKPEAEHARMRHLQEQLDQCWDLLRQRRARQEFGENPDAALVRDAGTVERYTG